MSHTSKLAATVAALVLTATALAGCTAAGESPASTSSQKPAGASSRPAQAPREQSTPTQSAVEIPKDPCPWPRPLISFVQDGKQSGNTYNPDSGPITGVLVGELVDLGPRKFANGTVRLNSAGEIVSYTVAPGDVYAAIYPRFCFTDYYSVINYNTGLEPLRTRPISQGLWPGDVLILRPDPNTRWVPQS